MLSLALLSSPLLAAAAAAAVAGECRSVGLVRAERSASAAFSRNIDPLSSVPLAYSHFSLLQAAVDLQPVAQYTRAADDEEEEDGGGALPLLRTR